MVLYITVAWGVIFSSSCQGEVPAAKRTSHPTTPVVLQMKSPTVGSSPVTEELPVNMLPSVEPNPSLIPNPAATPTLRVGEILDGMVLHELRVGIISEGRIGQIQEQSCTYSADNFYTCVVYNRSTQKIRIAFHPEQRGDLSTMDLERLQASMEVVVYPYWMISRYTPAPPLVDASIRGLNDGVWGADFGINSPNRSFSFFVMAEGRSLAGGNLYLVPPEPLLAAPLADEEQEN